MFHKRIHRLEALRWQAKFPKVSERRRLVREFVFHLNRVTRGRGIQYLFSGVRPSSGAAGLGVSEIPRSSGALEGRMLLRPRTAALRTLNTYGVRVPKIPGHSRPYDEPFHTCLLLLMVGFLMASCSKSPTPSANTQSPTDAETKIAAPQKTGRPWFEEAATQANLTFRHSSGHNGRFYMPEMLTGGAGLLDYDGDGLLDVFCVNGGSLHPGVTNPPGNKFYRNLGNWKFEDVTERAGLGGHGEYGMGCACADYDDDGRPDIYVTNLGANILYRNNGDGTFTAVTRQAGVGGEGTWGTSCAFFDYDGDGHLDLCIANYLRWSREIELECYSRGGQRDYCSPMNYQAPAMATLYHNRGDGTFENVTLAAGLDKAYGNGLGVVFGDFDHDGRPDIFIANDAMPNQLWVNQGSGRFIDEAMIRGCAVNSMGMAEAGMGVAAVDLLQRGRLDIFVTHLVGEGNRLWLNTGSNFIDTITAKGPGASSRPYTGFGVVFGDFDNDAQLDCYVANGRVKYGDRQLDPNDAYAEPNNLLRGLGNGDFEEIFPKGGTATALLATSRGVAMGDLDNDGALDLVVINKDGPAHLLRNRVGARSNWTMLRVLNRKGTDAFGAMLRLEAGGKTFWRHLNPNQSYCSSNDPRIHCGLGSAKKIERVIVHWPNSTPETFGPFDAGRLYEVREGTGSR